MPAALEPVPLPRLATLSVASKPSFDGEHPLGQTSAGPKGGKTVAVGTYPARANVVRVLDVGD